jgi:hypothetical protein
MGAALAARLAGRGPGAVATADALLAQPLFCTHPLVSVVASLDVLRMQEDPRRPDFFAYAHTQADGQRGRDALLHVATRRHRQTDTGTAHGQGRVR